MHRRPVHLALLERRDTVRHLGRGLRHRREGRSASDRARRYGLLSRRQSQHLVRPKRDQEDRLLPLCFAMATQLGGAHMEEAVLSRTWLFRRTMPVGFIRHQIGGRLDNLLKDAPNLIWKRAKRGSRATNSRR